MIKRLGSAIALTAVVASMGVPAPAHADDAEYTDLVEALLGAYEGEITKTARNEGMVLRKIYQDVDDIAPGKAMTFDLDTINPGVNHVALAVCDQDCADIDLYLKNSEDVVVEQDIETDAAPIVQFWTNPLQDYTLDLTMEACDANVCYYGVAIYEIVDTQ